MNKIKIIMLIIAICDFSTLSAQRNFYHRLDVGSSNIYTFVLSNLVTGYANYLSHDMLFDNSYIYTIYRGKMGGEKIETKAYSPMGLTAKEVFNDVYGGVKLGYQSDLMGKVNWGIYASGHYRVNQVKVLFPGDDVYKAERFQYFKPGMGILLTFGGIDQKVKVQLEAAARYDLPVGYSGAMEGKASDILKSGISSHFAVKIAGFSWLSAGLFADFTHHDIYKNMTGDSHFKPYSFGVTFTITPKRGEDLYD